MGVMPIGIRYGFPVLQIANVAAPALAGQKALFCMIGPYGYDVNAASCQSLFFLG